MLFEQIRDAIADERYLIGLHAAERLDERGIPDWQVVAAMTGATLILERPHNRPNPSIEARILLPDGTAAKAVWAWIAGLRAAKLVTVHYFDE